MTPARQRLLIIARGRRVALTRIAALARETGMEVRTLYRSLTGWGMKAQTYQTRYGEDVDFAAVAAHYVLAKQQAGRVKFLKSTSHFYNRLRRIAAHIDETFASFRPDAVIVYNGFNPQAQLALAKAAKYHVPALYAEGAIVPGSGFILDAGAPFFTSRGASQLEQNWPAPPLTDKQNQAISTFLQNWLAARSSKYRATENQQAALKDFLASDNRPLALIALQVKDDMNVALGLPPDGQRDYQAWVEGVLAHIPASWRVLVKPHPRGEYRPEINKPNMLCVDGGNLHDLLARADCVITLSSNVGLEAMMTGTPLIAPPHIYYGGKGLSLTLNAPAEISELLARVQTFRPPEDLRLRFLHYVLLDYHFSLALDSVSREKFRARLHAARPPQSFDWLPENYRLWPDIVRAYGAARAGGADYAGALAQAHASTPRFDARLAPSNSWLALLSAYWRNRLRAWRIL